MSKFTIFTVTLVVLICLMFAGLITYKIIAPQRQWEATQQEAIPGSVDDKTTEHATEVEAEAQKTADKTVEEATDEDKNLVVEYGDTVTIDYVGIQDGKEFDGGTATDASLEIGSNSFIPGYEIQLVDHKIGDVVEVLVTFPEDYNDATLAGKDAMFVVTIKGITKKA